MLAVYPAILRQHVLSFLELSCTNSLGYSVPLEGWEAWLDDGIVQAVLAQLSGFRGVRNGIPNRLGCVSPGIGNSMASAPEFETVDAYRMKQERRFAAMRKRKRQYQEDADWLRGQDLNLRPLGYEPNELPDCSTPQLDRNNRPSQGQCCAGSFNVHGRKLNS